MSERPSVTVQQWLQITEALPATEGGHTVDMHGKLEPRSGCLGLKTQQLLMHICYLSPCLVGGWGQFILYDSSTAAAMQYCATVVCLQRAVRQLSLLLL